MKDTPSSIPPTTDDLINSPIENHGDKVISKDIIAQQQNDENKNIIILNENDDDNNQNILCTSNNSDNHNKTLSHTQTTPNKYIEDECKMVKTNMDFDSNEMNTSQTETPLPDWLTLNESVLIRPYNHSGVISFIGPTHFSVNE